MPRPKPWCFPWPEPKGMYDSDGPPKEMAFDYKGRRFRVVPTSEVGCDTGRRRFRVECLSCAKLLHEATTGTSSRIVQHAEEPCGRDSAVAKEKEEGAEENYAFMLGVCSGLRQGATFLREKASALFVASKDGEARFLRELSDQLQTRADAERDKAAAYARSNGLKE